MSTQTAIALLKALNASASESATLFHKLFAELVEGGESAEELLAALDL